MLKYLYRKQRNDNKIQNFQEKMSLRTKSPEVLKEEIINLQIRLIKILLEESTLRSKKELIQNRLEEYQYQLNTQQGFLYEER